MEITPALPITGSIFVTGDLMAMRCAGGSTPGANCTGSGGCGTVAAGSCPGGTCVNDSGRCATGGGQLANMPCCSDGDCAGSGSCETGACVGGGNANFGCISDADCPNGICRTFIQPCPICDSITSKCDAGINEGLGCSPGVSAVDGDYPTTHDCPPHPASLFAFLPVITAGSTETVIKTAVELPDQKNVFCGFCKNKSLNSFARRCGGTTTGAVCTAATGSTVAPCSATAPCLPIACTANADCSSQTQSPGFTSCGQRSSGAFTSIDVARTIVETGLRAGILTPGGPAKPARLAGISCLPLTFSSLVDSASDLPGPAAAAVPITAQLLP